MKKFTMIATLLCGFAANYLTAGETLTVSYLERPPYYQTKNNRATGKLIELTRKILLDAGINAVYAPLPPKRIMWKIKDSSDAHCSVGWFKTPERELFAKFSLPIYKDKPLVVLTLKRNRSQFINFSKIEEVLSKDLLILGTISTFSYGSTIDQMITENSSKGIKVMGSQIQLIKMIATGRISYMLIAPEEVQTLILTTGLNIEDFFVLTLSNIPEGNVRYLIFSRGVPDEMITRINTSISKVVIF